MENNIFAKNERNIDKLSFAIVVLINETTELFGDIILHFILYMYEILNNCTTFGEILFNITIVNIFFYINKMTKSL
jgi:hypothetical protein